MSCLDAQNGRGVLKAFSDHFITKNDDFRQYHVYQKAVYCRAGFNHVQTAQFWRSFEIILA